MTGNLLLSAAQFAESLRYFLEISVVRLGAPAHAPKNTPGLTTSG